MGEGRRVSCDVGGSTSKNSRHHEVPNAMFIIHSEATTMTVNETMCFKSRQKKSITFDFDEIRTSIGIHTCSFCVYFTLSLASPVVGSSVLSS